MDLQEKQVQGDGQLSCGDVQVAQEIGDDIISNGMALDSNPKRAKEKELSQPGVDETRRKLKRGMQSV